MRARHEQNFLMLAAATLAGGGSAKQAVENARIVIDAFDARFPDEPDDGPDRPPRPNR